MRAAEIAAMARMFGKSVIRRGALPEFIIAYVTERCNLKCEHCFFWKEVDAPGGTMTVAEWRRIARHLSSTAMIALTGGEPFLRDDLDEIAVAFAEEVRPLGLQITSNGLLPARVEAMTRKILAGAPDLHLGVSISIDEPAQVHDRIRAHQGSWERAAETLDRLAHLRASQPRLKVATGTVFCKDNQDVVVECLLDIQRRWQPNSMALILVRGEPRDPALLAVDLARYKSAMDIVHGYSVVGSNAPMAAVGKAIGRAVSREKVDAITRVAERDEFVVPCVAGSLAGVIHSDGTVAPCEMLADRFGNLRDVEYDFRRLWQSDRAHAFRRRIVEERCRCTHECFVAPSVAFNPSRWPSMAGRVMRELF
jgi:MoaA/NifB/PqqE/SkfB family radical SAM enzyme